MLTSSRRNAPHAYYEPPERVPGGLTGGIALDQPRIVGHEAVSRQRPT